MDKQHTLLRYTRNTKIYRDRCAETREEVKMIIISKSGEQEATNSKLSRKDNKSSRRKDYKTRKKARFQRFKRITHGFLKWCNKNWKKILEIVLIGFFQLLRLILNR
jgi:hypothetical protein